MPTIKFLPEQITMEVAAGTTILQAERLAGIRQDAPCGGNGKCGKCAVWADGEKMLACRTLIQDDMTVTVAPGLSKSRILSDGMYTEVDVQPIQEGAYHISVDIGTTTVVVYMLDGTSGEVTGIRSMLNPQFPYGSDVISRIRASISGKLESLTGAIREAVWSMILELCKEQGTVPQEIGTVSVVGNPAMQQIFFGTAPDNLAQPPFSPVFLRTEIRPLSAYFPTDAKSALLVVPDIAGYVGADTMGCILATGMYRDSRMTLMLDAGTNGEMVLGNRDRMISCSTATGPALEGGQISCGMRGSEGAIDHVWLEDGHLQYSVIGDTEAQGICGSGIIDAAAVLLELGILNKRGRIQKDFQGEGKDRFYTLTDKVHLTQNDIREVQMAKGAIAAAIQLMVKYLNIQIKDIERVILCGAFGNYMKPESACRIGLLPGELLEKIESGGNAAGMGSRQMALNKDYFYLTDTLREKVEALELATFPEFQRTYASCMMF